MSAPDLSARNRGASDIAAAQTPPHESHDAIDARLAKLEEERQESRDHRTQVRTLLSLAGAGAVVVVLGAVTVRDTTLATAARLATLESRITALEASTSRRDADDRGTREAIVRLQTTVETLQSTIAHRLDAIDQRLSTTPR